MSNIRVFVYDEQGAHFETVSNDLHTFQNIVGGLITVYSIGENYEYDVVCNDEGILLNLEPRVGVVNDNGKGWETILFGNCFVCRHDADGNFTSLTEKDLAYIGNKLKWLDELQFILYRYFGLIE